MYHACAVPGAEERAARVCGVGVLGAEKRAARVCGVCVPGAEGRAARVGDVCTWTFLWLWSATERIGPRADAWSFPGSAGRRQFIDRPQGGSPI